MNGAIRTEGSRRERRGVLADDRLKDQWNDRLAWSMIVAVVVHAGVFVLWPDWEVSPRHLEDLRRPGTVEWISAADLAASGGAGGPEAVPVAESSDSLSEEDEASTASGGNDETWVAGQGASDSLTRALRDRLLGADGPTPTVAEPPTPAVTEPDLESVTQEAAEGEGSSTTTIGGRAATADVSDVPGEGAPDLGRLDSLRPELAFGLGSSSVLLRNPREVVNFMRTASRQRREVGSTRAWMSVTIWVDETGSVEWAEVSESTGREVLDEVGLALFRDVVAFLPAREEGVRVPKSMVFQIWFPW